MLNGFIISFREVFEIILIVVLILGFINSTKTQNLKKSLIIGTTLGILVSFIFGIIAFNLNEAFKEVSEAFEIITKGILFILITSFIVYSIKIVRSDISKQITDNISKHKTLSLGISLVSFFNVLREGIELSVFLLTSFITNRDMNIFWGVILGITFSLFLAFVIFKFSIKINFNWLFKIINIILIIVSAGIFKDILEEISKEIFKSDNNTLLILPGIYIMVLVYMLFINKNRKLE
ncbi:FTR1 family protein [Caldicellulosiruptoraceae bacterium PP1]